MRVVANCDRHVFEKGVCKRCAAPQAAKHEIHRWVVGEDERFQFCATPGCTAQRYTDPNVSVEAAPGPGTRHKCKRWEASETAGLEVCPGCGQTRLAVPEQRKVVYL